MKNLHVPSLTVLAISLLVIGCTEQEPMDLLHDQAKISQLEPRPDIGPGESNWTPPLESPSSKLLSTGLSTTDLSTQTPDDLVAALIGTGPDAPVISNVTFSGAKIAAGTFSGGTGIIGFESGIILSSGNIASVTGPNTADNTTTNNGLGGDAELDALIPGFQTRDATVLEFDFTCEEIQVISFQYVFTSEEYNEYVILRSTMSSHFS